jgi:hypothetical protein
MRCGVAVIQIADALVYLTLIRGAVGQPGQILEKTMTKPLESLSQRLVRWNRNRRLKRSTAFLDNHMRADVGLPLLPKRRSSSSLLFPYIDI